MTDEKYLIWSSEHRGWWKASRHGYTTRTDKAGQFSEQEARELVDVANEFARPYAPEEIMLPAPRRSQIEIDMEPEETRG